MNNIKKLLKAKLIKGDDGELKSMSLEDLAKITGYSSRHLRYLQNGEKQPTIKLARLIAYVLTGEDDIRKVWK